MMQRSRALGWLALLAAIGGVGLWTLRPRAVERPNVLVIVWDTVRADRTSLYGHPVETTPRLAARARRGVVFERATAPAMWTLPTHAAMFTGQFTPTHGATASHRWLDHHHHTLAEHLRDAGYDTFAFTSNLVASPATTLLQGFDTIHTTWPRSGRGRYASESRRATLGKLLPDDASTEISPRFAGDAGEKWARAIYKDAAPVIHRGLVEWLDERRRPDRPWFAYLNMMEAHSPRIPSAEARARAMDPATRARALTVDQSLAAANAWMVGRHEYTDADLAAIRGVYDAALVDLDTATGDLLDELEARGELARTVVVLLSDHGEHLGEHGRLEHRWSLRQPLLHVPLVVWDPARAPGRVTRRVSTAGLFATLLEAAGLPVPPEIRAPSWFSPGDGGVFAQLLDPFVSRLESVREVHPTADYTEFTRTFCAAFSGDDKLLVSSTGERWLHDLASDPRELHDTSRARPERAEALLQALAAWEASLPAHDASRHTPRDRDGAHQDATERRMLAALGYTAEEPAADAPPSCFRTIPRSPDGSP